MTFSIGEVAEAAGVGVETIRFYERKGLLPEPPRDQANFRVYPVSTVERTRFIRRARSVGLSLAEIQELLVLCLDEPPKTAATARRARNALRVVEKKLRAAARLQGVLQDMLSRS